jgi:predicted ATPase
MLATLAIANYRSLRSLILPLSELNIITGPNGSGKSSVYRSLKLLADIAQGGAIASIAREGGFQSTLWAGPETVSASMVRGDHPIEGAVRKQPVSLRLGIGGASLEEFSYAIDLGLPQPLKPPSAFYKDPEIKSEYIWTSPVLRPSTTLVERRGAMLRVNGDAGWQTIDKLLPHWASMMTEFADPARAPEMITLREQMRSWRFYDHFRCDSAAPARQPQLGSRTTVMAGDGADCAAALQTILEIGDAESLAEAVDDAFPGSRLAVDIHDGRFDINMWQHGMLRALRAAELSDGTLRYLLWMIALLTPRPPALMVLNEPETSLHPDLLPALGRLIVKASRHTQMIVVSHAPRLIAAMEDAAAGTSIQSIVLHKELGETKVANVSSHDIPAWSWPKR